MNKFYPLLISLFFLSAGYSQNYKFGKVSKEEVLEESHPLEPDANAAVLFRELNTYYQYNRHSGFDLVTEVHERIKIYNKDGFDWATKEISYFQNGSSRERITGIRGNTYSVKGNKLVREKLRKDGIFDEEVSDYQLKTKLTLPAVTEGSVIEYKYTLRSPFITSIDDIYLQYTIPVNKLEATVSIPKFFVFKTHVNLKAAYRFTVETKTKNVNYGSGNNRMDFIQNISSVQLEDIPALKEEAHIDHLQNYAAFLKWELSYTELPNSPIQNYAQTWDGVAKSIYADGGYNRAIARTNFFDNDLDEVLEGITDPMEKVSRIYNFTKEKVKWNEYLGFTTINGTRKAYRDGEGNVGDINLLLTAMLNYAGLNSNPVLVSTQDNGIPLFPTRDGFNYVVSSVTIGDQIILLDATDPTAALGELPKRARNWQGRIIRKDETSSWVDLMPQYQSGNTASLNIQFAEDLTLEGRTTNMFTGLHAKKYRDNFGGINAEKYIQHLETNKGSISISNVEKENEGEIGKEVKETYEFQLQDGIEVINDKIYFRPLLFLALEENPFKADERHYPIIFDYPTLENKTVNIMIPEGFEVESLPESTIAVLNDGAGTFKFVTTQSGNFLRIQSTLDIRNTVYTPQDYQALKNFFAQMIEKQTETLVLSKI